MKPRVIRGGGVLGGEFGGEALDRALRIHDLADGHAGEIELHRERLGEQPRIALRNPRAAAVAHLDVDDALRLQRAQRIARDDPADAEALRQVLLGAEEIARLELLGEQRLADLADDLGRHGRGAERNDLPFSANCRMDFSPDSHVISVICAARP